MMWATRRNSHVFVASKRTRQPALLLRRRVMTAALKNFYFSKKVDVDSRVKDLALEAHIR